MALAEAPEFGIPPRRLREIARARAANDSEFAAWRPNEALAFEATSESLPRTAFDLQRLTLGRLSDLQHALLHADFAQGATVAGLESEAAVQNWTADRLRIVQGRSYTVEREPHVVDEKEPDIRVRSATDASVPIEVKVAESWSLSELERALETQLCGQYLRARGGRHGILLLVHQQARTRGWTVPGARRYMTFDEVVDHLRTKAKEIAGRSPDAPQPEIAVLDVSNCARGRS